MLRFLFRNLRSRFRDQRREIRSLTDEIRPGEIAVDVGANKGSYLLWLSRRVGEGKVVAFEPLPNLAEYLRRVVGECRLTNVIVEQKAVSDVSRGAVLYAGIGAAVPGSTLSADRFREDKCQRVEIQTTTLDDYFATRTRRVAAVKIDVEGHEPAVFRGAERLLAEDAPVLVFECEERHLAPGRVREVLDWLSERDYGGWFIHRQRLIPIREFDPAYHQLQDGPRFFAKPDYCNNFVMRRAA